MSDTPSPTGAPPWWKDRLQELRTWFVAEGAYPFALFAITRLTYLALSAIGLATIPILFFHPEARQHVLEPYPAIDGLCRWDCGWFVTLVKEGYSTAENAKIFPLFPLIGWAVEKATGIHHIVVFLVVSNLASLGSYFVIFRLFKKLEDEAAARQALLLFATFPWAFYQAAAYAESLMIFFTALAVTWALSGRHLRAGVALGLGVMTRHVGIFYGPALFAAQVRQRGIHPKRLVFHPAVIGLMVPFAFVGVFAWHLKEKLGDPLAFWNARTIGWGDMVWFGARDIFRNFTYAEKPEIYWMMAIGLIIWAGSLLLLTRNRWLELACAALPSIVVFYSSGAAAGLGRYTASVWPAFLPLGVWLAKRPNLQGPVIACFAMVQGLLFFLFSHQWRVI